MSSYDIYEKIIKVTSTSRLILTFKSFICYEKLEIIKGCVVFPLTHTHTHKAPTPSSNWKVWNYFAYDTNFYFIFKCYSINKLETKCRLFSKHKCMFDGQVLVYFVLMTINADRKNNSLKAQRQSLWQLFPGLMLSFNHIMERSSAHTELCCTKAGLYKSKQIICTT